MTSSANAEHPIEVVTFVDGKRRDSAECDTPDEARSAAIQLLHDAKGAGCSRPRASFYVHGKLLRGDVSLAAVEYTEAVFAAAQL